MFRINYLLLVSLLATVRAQESVQYYGTSNVRDQSGLPSRPSLLDRPYDTLAPAAREILGSSPSAPTPRPVYLPSLNIPKSDLDMLINSVETEPEDEPANPFTDSPVYDPMSIESGFNNFDYSPNPTFEFESSISEEQFKPVREPVYYNPRSIEAEISLPIQPINSFRESIVPENADSLPKDPLVSVPEISQPKSDREITNQELNYTATAQPSILDVPLPEERISPNREFIDPEPDDIPAVVPSDSDPEIPEPMPYPGPTDLDINLPTTIQPEEDTSVSIPEVPLPEEPISPEREYIDLSDIPSVDPSNSIPEISEPKPYPEPTDLEINVPTTVLPEEVPLPEEPISPEREFIDPEPNDIPSEVPSDSIPEISEPKPYPEPTDLDISVPATVLPEEVPLSEEPISLEREFINPEPNDIPPVVPSDSVPEISEPKPYPGLTDPDINLTTTVEPEEDISVPIPDLTEFIDTESTDIPPEVPSVSNPEIPEPIPYPRPTDLDINLPTAIHPEEDTSVSIPEVPMPEEPISPEREFIDPEPDDIPAVVPSDSDPEIPEPMPYPGPTDLDINLPTTIQPEEDTSVSIPEEPISPEREFIDPEPNDIPSLVPMISNPEIPDPEPFPEPTDLDIYLPVTVQPEVDDIIPDVTLPEEPVSSDPEFILPGTTKLPDLEINSPATVGPLDISVSIPEVTTPHEQPYPETDPDMPEIEPNNDLGEVVTTETPIDSFNDADYACHREYKYFPVKECDSYVICKNNVIKRYVCPDGLHFNPRAVYPNYPCSYPSEVQCQSGYFAQDPDPTNECPRQFGYFGMNDGDCSRYIMCQDGLATVMNCPLGLVFNVEQSSCDWPENVPYCNPYVFRDLVCPQTPLNKFGEPSDRIYKYRYGRSCNTFLACHRGRPRLLSCDEGLAFEEKSQSCISDIRYVRECDKFPSQNILYK